MLKIMALYWPPRLKKGYHNIFATLGVNVPAFIKFLMSML
jgi:hypothetical protein